jgi:hypothetical protein
VVYPLLRIARWMEQTPGKRRADLETQRAVLALS